MLYPFLIESDATEPAGGPVVDESDLIDQEESESETGDNQKQS